MSIAVYTWPCVGVVGREWTVSDPISRSRSMITGKDYISSAQRRRRMAVLDVSGRSVGNQGAGYMEAMKRILLGGVNAVRLYSMPINYGPLPDEDLHTKRLLWTSGSDDLEWTAGGTDLYWYTGGYLGQIATATLMSAPGDLGRVSVSGLPPSSVVAKAGEFVTIYEDDDDTVGVTIMVLQEARSNGSGVASIWLTEEPPFVGRINVGTRETGVFRPEAMPRAIKPSGPTDWTYGWSFREIFEDEVDGGFDEIDPWN